MPLEKFSFKWTVCPGGGELRDAGCEQHLDHDHGDPLRGPDLWQLPRRQAESALRGGRVRRHHRDQGALAGRGPTSACLGPGHPRLCRYVRLNTNTMFPN